MQIKHRLTYQFISIVALILTISSISIYFSAAEYRRDEFYTRLYNKAKITAKLLIEVEEVDADLLKRIEKDNPVNMSEERIVIYNHKNEELFSTDDENIIKPDTELFNRIRLEEHVKYELGEHEVLGFLFKDKYDRFVILISANDIYGKNKMDNLRTVLFTVFGLSILLAFISGWIYATRAIKPINLVIKQVDNIGISSLNLRVQEGNGKDEIAKLAFTFNKMLERLENAFKVQKNFIANASHELRTPLAIITGQMEVVLMNERKAGEYRGTIESVLEDMKSLSSLSNRLLLLAQTSTEYTETNFDKIRLDEVIWKVCAEVRKRQPEYILKVDLAEHLEDRQLTILGNEQFCKTIFINLIDNACKYSNSHSAIINIYTKNNMCVVDVIDNGIGIDPTDINHIFEPFHRGINTRTYKGHGIGLSLVERIVTLLNGKIKVESGLSQGSTFQVSLPHI